MELRAGWEAEKRLWLFVVLGGAASAGFSVRWSRYEPGFPSEICGKEIPPPGGSQPTPGSFMVIIFNIAFMFCLNSTTMAADRKSFQAGSGLPEAAFIKISFCPYFMFIAAIFN